MAYKNQDLTVKNISLNDQFDQERGYLDTLSAQDNQSTPMEWFSDRRRRRQWHPTPVLLPGKSHGWRSLEGCSPQGRWLLDTTECLHFHFSLSCIGGNGNRLQCSCLENPKDGEAWWATVYAVAQSRTRLKRLSSSSSSDRRKDFFKD